jgi:hypothetical protein
MKPENSAAIVHVMRAIKLTLDPVGIMNTGKAHGRSISNCVKIFGRRAGMGTVKNTASSPWLKREGPAHVRLLTPRSLRHGLIEAPENFASKATFPPR